MVDDDFQVVTKAGKVGRPPKVDPSPVVDVSPKVDLLVILDTSFDDVLRFDDGKGIVRFDAAPGRFKRLNDAQIDQLSAFTRGVYLDAERTHRRLLEKADDPNLVTGGITQYARATDRLEIRNKQPGMHYAWRRPDEYRQATVYEGYKVVDDENLDTFVKGPTTVRTVGTHGNPELIAMAIPEAVYMERLKANETRSRERNQGAQAAGAAELARQGGRRAVYDPDANPVADAKRDWVDKGTA